MLEENYNTMRKYARKLTNNAHYADDIVQDAMYKAITSNYPYTRSYLHTLVFRSFISVCRKNKSFTEIKNNLKNAQPSYGIWALYGRSVKDDECLVSAINVMAEQKVRLSECVTAFKTMPDNYRQIMQAAINEEDPNLTAKRLGYKNPLTLNVIRAKIRKKYLRHLL